MLDYMNNRMDNAVYSIDVSVFMPMKNVRKYRFSLTAVQVISLEHNLSPKSLGPGNPVTIKGEKAIPYKFRFEATREQIQKVLVYIAGYAFAVGHTGLKAKSCQQNRQVKRKTHSSEDLAMAV